MANPFKPLPEERLLLVNRDASSSEYSESIDQASAYLRVAAEKLSVPSISVSVGINGEVVWSEAVGLSDIDNHIPATTTTLYRTNGVAKSITAAAIMKMVESNMIDLDMPVNHLFPNIDGNNPDFTTRELLTHTAGIGYHDDLGIAAKLNSLCECMQFDSVSDAMSLVNGYDLTRDPGHEYHYSSYGYIMISKILEDKTGLSFYNLLRDSVLSPLDISSVMPDHYPEPIAKTDKIVSYKTTGGNYKVWPTLKILFHDRNLSYDWAAGGMLATPTDLVKIGNALLTDPEFVSPEIFHEFTSPQKYRNGEYIRNQEVALGWSVITNHPWDIHKDYREDVTILRSGSVKKGSGNILLLIPEYNFVIDVAVNGSEKNWSFEPLWNEVLTLSKFFLMDLKPSHLIGTKQAVNIISTN
ncbi:serine hydrolase domain-containing protein [Rhodohalobacter mucosus]|nr:serine hydrolase domain-containing protein [Rhodohalobacter mucosus]